jgi:CRP/FNR family transcriptional regulator, cyclic AMP receptor protein
MVVHEKDAGYLRDAPYMVGSVEKYSHELSLLLHGSKIRTYRANEVIFRQGEVSDRFYFIKEGTVQVTISGPDGAEKIAAIQERGTFSNDTSLDGYPSLATVVALEDSEIYVITKAHFESCVKTCPTVALMILESVIRKARINAFQVGYLSLLNAKGRVAQVLLTLAHEIGTESEEGIVIGRRITHETLAGLTGLARPTLTSALNDLERSKMIKTRNRTMIIIDMQGLAEAMEKIDA